MGDLPADCLINGEDLKHAAPADKAGGVAEIAPRSRHEVGRWLLHGLFVGNRLRGCGFRRHAALGTYMTNQALRQAANHGGSGQIWFDAQIQQAHEIEHRANLEGGTVINDRKWDIDDADLWLAGGSVEEDRGAQEQANHG